MDEVRYIDAAGRGYALPAFRGRVLVPRDLVAALPELVWASEHEEAPIAPALHARLAAIELVEDGCPRPLDPARGGFLVPLAEWHLWADRAPAPAPPVPASASRGGTLAHWPPGTPWPPPAPPPARPRADLPALLGRAGGGLLALANLGVLAAAAAWALESWGSLGPNNLLGGALILAAAGLFARLAGGSAAAPSLAGALARIILALVLGTVILSTLLA